MLTPQKLAHIDAMIAKAQAGRTQLVDLTLRQTDGSTSVLTVPALWRAVQDADPSLGPSYGETAAREGDADIIAVFNVSDVSFHQLRSCIYASLHPGEGQGVEPAHRYVNVAIEVKGIKPGGTRYLTHWIRQQP